MTKMGPDVCLKCAKEIQDSAKGDNKIKCALCNCFSHNSCYGITPSVYKYLTTSVNHVLWSCDNCAKAGNVVTQLFEKLKDLTQKLTECDEKIRKLESSATQSPSLRKRTFSSVLVNANNYTEPSPKIQRITSKQQQQQQNQDKQKQQRQTQQKKSHVVVVQTKDQDKRNEIEASVKNIIDPLTDPITRCRKTMRGKVVIECKDEESVKMVKNKLTQNMPNDFEVDTPKPVMPMIKIVSVSDYKSNDQLFKYMRKQNSDVFDEDDKLEYVTSYKPTTKAGVQQTTTVIVKLTHRCFVKALEKKRLLINWDSCKVYEHVDVQRCYKCSRLGHYVDTCPSDTYTCARCMGPHSVSMCDSAAVLRCANCVDVNATKNLDLPVDHCAWSAQCPVMMRRAENVKKNIIYSSE